MMTKKRVFALLMSMIMTIALTLPVSAAGGTVTSEDGTQATVVNYSIVQTFTVTIPQSVTIDPSTKKGSGMVSVSDAIIPYGEAVQVTITGATNYDNTDKFRLKDGNNDNYVKYVIKAGETTVNKGSPFLSVPAGTAIGSTTLNFEAEAPTKAGNYTDSLTFTVSVQ